MYFTKKVVLVVTCGLTLIAADVIANTSEEVARQKLNSRELAATGIAINVTIRGGEDCEDASDSRRSDSDDAFRELFGMDRPFPRSKPSQASGTIISSDGEILSLSITGGCASYPVTLPDGREVSALAVGFDEQTQVALLRVEETGLTAARIGDPDALRPGDRVLAVGSPFGMENTLSAGMVSTARRYMPSESASHYIQTDAMINPGSAGGPLLNEYGEVIGAHALLLTRRNAFDGLSFAIPIDVALRIVADLREFGRVRRAWLGITIDQFEPVDTGVTITDVEPEGPLAAHAQKDDVIVAFDGEPVAAPGELQSRLLMNRVGAEVSLSLVRGDETIDVTVTLTERPPD